MNLYHLQGQSYPWQKNNNTVRQWVTLSFCNTKVLHRNFTTNNRFNT